MTALHHFGNVSLSLIVFTQPYSQNITHASAYATNYVKVPMHTTKPSPFHLQMTNDSPHDANSGTFWGAKRISRRMPAHAPIQGRTSLFATIFTCLRSVPDHIPNSATKPAVKTSPLGAADTLYDNLSEEQFLGWSTYRQCQLTFVGPDGFFTSKRAELLRYELATSSDLPSAGSHLFTLLAPLEGFLQIPGTITTPGIRSPRHLTPCMSNLFTPYWPIQLPILLPHRAWCHATSRP